MSQQTISESSDSQLQLCGQPAEALSTSIVAWYVDTHAEQFSEALTLTSTNLNASS